MTYQASERKDIRKAEKAQAIHERARLEFVFSMMATISGRTWAYDLLVRCHIFQNPFTPDALATAFGCGEMNIGQAVLADIMQACPDQYVIMMREANVRHISNNRSTASEQPGSEDPNGGIEEPVVEPTVDDIYTTFKPNGDAASQH
jgi:hypothetical protein